MASIAEEMKDIREYDKANEDKGIALENRILLLNAVFDEWIFTPNKGWDKILAMRAEDVRTTTIEV